MMSSNSSWTHAKQYAAPFNHGKKWTKEERLRLVRLLTDRAVTTEMNPTEYIAKVLGRSNYAIECQTTQIDTLGIPAYIAPRCYEENAAQEHSPFFQGADGDVKNEIHIIKTKENTMTSNHILSLIQKNYTTVKVEFYTTPDREYTYKVSKDLGLKVDDWVVVSGPSEDNKFSVAKVIEVHAEPEINLTSTMKYKWIVQKVNDTWATTQLEKEETFLARAAKLAKRKRDAKVMEEFKAMMPEDEAAQQELKDAMLDLQAPISLAVEQK